MMTPCLYGARCADQMFCETTSTESRRINGVANFFVRRLGRVKDAIESRSSETLEVKCGGDTALDGRVAVTDKNSILAVSSDHRVPGRPGAWRRRLTAGLAASGVGH